MRLEYFIVLVAPDANSLVGRHQFFQTIVQEGHLNNIVRNRTGEDSIQGYLSLARNTREAVEAIDRNFKHTKNAVQIVCTDYSVNPFEGGYGPTLMGDRILNGLDLTEHLRWNFVGKKMGSLVFQKELMQLPEDEMRSKGAYETVSEPLHTDEVLSSFDRLLQAIFSKQVPVKQEVSSVYIARIIDDYRDFAAACRLSYGVYEHLRYLGQQNPLRIDLDKFSPYSIPFGVFEQTPHGEVLLGTTRLIFREKQEPFSSYVEAMLEAENPRLDNDPSMTLADYVYQPLKAFSPMAESVDLSDMLEDWEKNQVNYAESSRNVAHPDHRGYGVSRLAMASSLTHAFYSGLDLLIGQSDVNHVPMYQKYGVVPIPDKSLYMEDTVQNITAALMIDFREPLPGPAEYMIKQVYRDKWARGGFLCQCPNRDCTRKGAPFIAQDSNECPLKDYRISSQRRN